MSIERWEKPKTERKLNRIKAIYWYIKKNDAAKISDLTDEFGVCCRTIQRDIDVLVYNGLVKHSKRGLWTVTDRKVKGE